MLHRTDGAISAPAATAWLASGPQFGLAVVTLDPAGAYQEIVLLTPDPTSSWHILGGSSLPPPCAQGTPATLGTLALGDTCGTGESGSLQAPANALSFWTTPLPAGNVYIILHIAAQATRPAGATTITLPAGQGWSTRSGAYTSAVLQLPHGQTFALAGTASPARVESLAAEIAAQINAVAPIPTALPMPPGVPPTPSGTP